MKDNNAGKMVHTPDREQLITYPRWLRRSRLCLRKNDMNNFFEIALKFICKIMKIRMETGISLIDEW